MSFLRYFGQFCYFLLAASLILSSKPAFLGRWGFELSLFVVLLLGLIYRPYMAWLRIFTRSDTVRLPNGREVRVSTRQRVLFASAGIACLLIPCEIAFRVNRHNQKKALEQFHPFLQNQNRALDARLHVNAHGFRGEEIEKKKPAGTFRIFVMGGSTVFCERVPWENSHVRLLERRLREAYPARRFEVMNAGLSWYTTQHSLINYLFKINDFDPDLVILWHGINDLYRSFTPKKLTFGDYESDYSHYYGSVSRMAFSYFRGDPTRSNVTRIALLDRILQVLIERFSSEEHEEVPVKSFRSLGAFRRNLEQIASFIRGQGRRFVLCGQPSIYKESMNEEEKALVVFPRNFCVQDGKIPDLASMLAGMQSFNATTKEVALRKQIPYLDLDAKVPKIAANFTDDFHYSLAGNGIVAEALFEFLKEKKLLR